MIKKKTVIKQKILTQKSCCVWDYATERWSAFLKKRIPQLEQKNIPGDKTEEDFPEGVKTGFFRAPAPKIRKHDSAYCIPQRRLYLKTEGMLYFRKKSATAEPWLPNFAGKGRQPQASSQGRRLPSKWGNHLASNTRSANAVPNANAPIFTKL